MQNQWNLLGKVSLMYDFSTMSFLTKTFTLFSHWCPSITTFKIADFKVLQHTKHCSCKCLSVLETIVYSCWRDESDELLKDLNALISMSSHTSRSLGFYFKCSDLTYECSVILFVQLQLRKRHFWAISSHWFLNPTRWLQRIYSKLRS